VDAVLHLAGVNRDEPDALREVNLRLAEDLTAAMDRAEVRPTVVYANSIQSGNGTPFGDGKQAAGEHLARWGQTAGAKVTDVRLPNLFGEHGRPHYNSVVATFCHQLATGGEPVIDQDRELPLLHVQDAVDILFDLAAPTSTSTEIRPAGGLLNVSTVLELLTGFRDAYATGDIPDIADPMHLALFNTYRSFTFPALFPIHPGPREDARGRLFEAVRAAGGPAHVFVSTSRPGAVRGEHFHRRKVERFLVLRGTAEIALRRLFDDEIVRFEVSGDVPAVVDMPTMWAHSITNTGDDELMTMFWANEILDPQRPDTYPEPVQRSAHQAVGGG
jgi:UDP-2-acetamido-2,6-beta-L-arabino-hexul-4-ose reductase